MFGNADLDNYYGTVTMHDPAGHHDRPTVNGRVRSVSGVERLYHRMAGRTTAWGRRIRLVCIQEVQGGLTLTFGTPVRTGGYSVDGTARLHRG